jgi:NAD+ synthase
MNPTGFSPLTLELDAEAEVARLAAALHEAVHRQLRRGGAVVGISGGVDSSVVLALCARALGPERVVGVMLPERDSSPDSARLAAEVASQYGVQTVTEDITAALEGFGCYARATRPSADSTRNSGLDGRPRSPCRATCWTRARSTCSI